MLQLAVLCRLDDMHVNTRLRHLINLNDLDATRDTIFPVQLLWQTVHGRLDLLTRKAKSCSKCNSSPRTRAVIRTLSSCLFQENLILSEFPIRKDIKGLGLTDPESYAPQLKQRFDYLNTYFHQKPRLDIASATVPPEQRQLYDFIISPEVFEHVVSPRAKSFRKRLSDAKTGQIADTNSALRLIS